VASSGLRLVPFVCALASGPARGAEQDAAARGNFLAGQAYFSRGEYRLAIAAFRAARDELDRPELDYNIALAQERLGDAARAVGAYERYLERRPDATDRAEIEQRIRGLRPHIGYLKVSRHPRSASLLLDGEPVPETEETLRATGGPHTVTLVSGTRHLDEARAIVEPGPTRVVSLRAARSRWWIGVAVAGVALAGAAVGLGVGLTTTRVAPPQQGNLGVLAVP
jgi:tetratricopeptide (TPR) repeat protein